MSRSEFFVCAAQRYLDDLDAQWLTHQIDDTLARLDASDDVTEDAVAIGRHLLVATGEEW